MKNVNPFLLITLLLCAIVVLFILVVFHFGLQSDVAALDNIVQENTKNIDILNVRTKNLHEVVESHGAQLEGLGDQLDLHEEAVIQQQGEIVAARGAAWVANRRLRILQTGMSVKEGGEVSLERVTERQVRGKKPGEKEISLIHRNEDGTVEIYLTAAQARAADKKREKAAEAKKE